MRDVARRAAVILLVRRLRFEVLIEARHIDNADSEFLVATLDLAYLLLRCLRFQRDLVAHQFEFFLRRPRGRTGRQDLQMHGRADLAANQLHHVVQAPADDIDRLAVLAFADRDDAIVGIELAAGGRRTARQDVQHGDVVIDELQRGADALVRKAHLNAVFLGVARREVARMRIEHMGERIHEHFENIVAGDLLGALEHALVALVQDVLGLGPVLIREHEREGVVLDALAPDFVELRR